MAPTQLEITGLKLEQASGVEPASTFDVLANYTVTQSSEKEARSWNEAMLSSPDLLQVIRIRRAAIQSQHA